MIVLFLKDCGIYEKGTAVECARAKGEQYINGGFAVEGTAEIVAAAEPKPDPEPKPAAKKAPSKKAPTKKTPVKKKAADK